MKIEVGVYARVRVSPDDVLSTFESSADRLSYYDHIGLVVEMNEDEAGISALLRFPLYHDSFKTGERWFAIECLEGISKPFESFPRCSVVE